MMYPLVGRVMTTAAAVVWLLVSAFPCPAGAQLNNEAQVCPVDEAEIDAWEELRALSLALRGPIPTLDEYAALEETGEVPVALIDEWLASEAFAEQALRRLRKLLWNNISNVNPIASTFALSRDWEHQIYWRTSSAVRYRGAQVMCLDEPAELLPSGAIATTEVDGALLEGWVLVSPYWAPETEIKVCAFDAQEAEIGLTGVACGTLAGRDDTSCGCGVGLQHCAYGYSSTAIMTAFGEDVDRRVRAIIMGDEPYTELFGGSRAFVNGPLVHFYRHLASIHSAIRFDPLPLDPDALPDLDYTDVDTWAEVDLGPAHAGVLTSPAYLLRFQTNKARAARFYDAFLCQPFTPPEGGIPLGGEPVPDMQERDGCKGCHIELEPAAAYWGRWPEKGAGYTPPDAFPRWRPDCTSCAEYGILCNEDCQRFYLISPTSPEEAEYLGQLLPYVWRHAEHELNIEAGPELLVKRMIVDGRLPRCTARRAVEWLLGREPHAMESDWLDELALGFVQSNFSYRALVRAIVTHETYRRVR